PPIRDSRAGSPCVMGAFAAMGAEERLPDSVHSAHSNRSKTAYDLRAPLRNRTVDLLLTIRTFRCDGRVSCTDDTRERTETALAVLGVPGAHSTPRSTAGHVPHDSASYHSGSRRQP